VSSAQSATDEGSGELKVALPDRVGVLGGGRMGSGIAHAFLLGGCQVVVVERDEEESAAARGRVEAAVLASEKRGLLSGTSQDALGRLTSVADRDALAGCGLVVEAVPEVLELKTQALADVEQRLDPGAVAPATRPLPD